MIYAIVIATVITAVGVFSLHRLVKRVITRVDSRLQAFFTAPNAKTPSEYAQHVDMAGALLAQRLESHIKGSLMGCISAVARNEKALMRDIGKEAVSADNPLMGVLLEQLPKKWQNKIFENPAAAQAALKLFGGMGGPAPPANGNGHAAQIGGGLY